MPLDGFVDWTRHCSIEGRSTLDKVVQAVRQASCATAFGGLAAHFQKVHYQHSHVTHGRPFAVREFGTRLSVENEETTDVDVAVRGERRSGIKPKVRVFLHDWKILVSFIMAQVG